MSAFQLGSERKLHCVTTYYKLVCPKMTGLEKSATKGLIPNFNTLQTKTDTFLLKNILLLDAHKFWNLNRMY
jgi:hypothetical protein